MNSIAEFFEKTGITGNKIREENVVKFISYYKDFKIGDKTTVVQATLMNGFELIESSSCVDIKTFDQDIGIDICMQRIKDKVWHYLGFMLQTFKEVSPNE